MIIAQYNIIIQLIIYLCLQDISALGIVDLAGYTVEVAPEIKKKQ